MTLSSEKHIGLMRLAAHHITVSQWAKPEDAVKHMVAMQAQDYNGGLWSVGVRTVDASQSDVEKAIRDKKIIRTWPMRGTLHVVHADDVRWLLDLLAPRATEAARTRRVNQLGLTDEIVDQVEKILRAELAGGKTIARNEVTTLLHENVKGFDITSQHTQHLMRHFGERGVLCFGPHAGKQPTFVLLDEWVAKTASKSRPDALKELAKRYFMSHGPATLKDFAGWGMLKVTDARFGLEAVKNELAEQTVDGTVYYYDPAITAVNQSEVLLLPGFDEFLLGYKGRDDVLNIEHAQKVVPGNNGMFLATVVKDGQVIGLWKKQIKKDGIVFHYDGFYSDALGGKSYQPMEQRYRSFLAGGNR